MKQIFTITLSLFCLLTCIVIHADTEEITSDFFYCDIKYSDFVEKNSILIQLKLDLKLAVVTYTSSNEEFECKLMESKNFDYFLLCENSFLPEIQTPLFMTMSFPAASIYSAFLKNEDAIEADAEETSPKGELAVLNCYSNSN